MLVVTSWLCMQVVYVTATLPYILIFAFLIRAVTLDGSYDGIKRYILPEWGQLITFAVCVFLRYCILHPSPQFWHKTGALECWWF